MPLFRICQSSTNGTPAAVHSTFYEINQQAAYNKFKKIIDTQKFTFSYLWLEYYNEQTCEFKILKYPPPTNLIY